MKKKHSLWGGGKTPLAPAFEEMNRSLEGDLPLSGHEIRASIAWAEALRDAGVLTRPQAARIARGLRALEGRKPAGAEDIHTWVEQELYREIGEDALRLHTGRSRNDQVATALRLWCLEEGRGLERDLVALDAAILRRAERDGACPWPAYTHLRRAQPVLLAHWLLSWHEMLVRDHARIAHALESADCSPLGSGAVAGTAWPVDRRRLARRLGFTRVSANSVDATSDRDFALDLGWAGAVLLNHLSRLAEDLALLSSDEFGLLRLGDDVTTGSSLMPQKRNPDACELVRGRAATAIGDLAGLLALGKGLPTSYARDLQEGKVPLFRIVESAGLSLRVMAEVIAGLRVDREQAELLASDPAILATDLADRLVREKGIPFRTAHGIVREQVLAAASGEAPGMRPGDSLRRRSAIGGTAPRRVAAALAAARTWNREKGGAR